MKELNIMEASNMLNTEFEVIYPSGDKRTTNIKTNAVGNLLECDTGELSECFIGIINAKFIPIQKPVNFDYAISKGLEGQRIKVDVTKLNEEYSDVYTCVLNNAWNNVYYSIERIFEMLSKATYCKEIIKEGEWYVEE
ncbi:hypothetical protein FC831_10545 [Clostridium botulinum]|nr:hypothetical protein [Clostridium botulinum]